MSARSAKSEKGVRFRRLKAQDGWLAAAAGTQRGVLLRITACVIAVGAAVGGAAWGLGAMRRYVEQNPRRAHVAVQVRLHEQPAWMPASLAGRITASLLPADADLNDPDLTTRVHNEGAAIPWVAKVQRVTKSATGDPGVGVVDVYAEFRQPVARVLSADGRSVMYVGDDARLIGPEAPQFVARLPGEPARTVCFMRAEEAPANLRAVPIHYMTIRGVKAPAPAPGQTWAGDDLADALRLVRLLWNMPYSSQIAEVDVRNFAGRVNPDAPHLYLLAGRAGTTAWTQIVFGRFPYPEGDWGVPTDRKLANLSAYVAGHRGTLAGAHWQIDLRHNPLHCMSYPRETPLRVGSGRGEPIMELSHQR